MIVSTEIYLTDRSVSFGTSLQLSKIRYECRVVRYASGCSRFVDSLGFYLAGSDSNLFLAMCRIFRADEI